MVRNISMEEFICGRWADADLAMVLKGYFDDSGDDKRKRFSAVGGLVGGPPQWSHFEKRWSVATYDLKEPFHATDCEAQQGCCHEEPRSASRDETQPRVRARSDGD